MSNRILYKRRHDLSIVASFYVYNSEIIINIGKIH